VLFNLSCYGAPRRVTRLDGARGKKQVWRPHVRTWGLSEANTLYLRKYLWHCWDFSAPTPQSFAAPRSDLVPHSDSAPGELCPTCPPRYAPGCTLKDVLTNSCTLFTWKMNRGENWKVIWKSSYKGTSTLQYYRKHTTKSRKEYSVFFLLLHVNEQLQPRNNLFNLIGLAPGAIGYSLPD